MVSDMEVLEALREVIAEAKKAGNTQTGFMIPNGTASMVADAVVQLGCEGYDCDVTTGDGVTVHVSWE